jgi:hypothetical protein
MTMKTPLAALAVSAGLMGAAAWTAAPQNPPAPSLATALVGEWRGTGVVTGRQSQVSMAWSLDLGGTFLHLRFRNAMAAGGGRPAEVFEGRGYYRLSGSSSPAAIGTWIDSRGLILPVTVSFTSDTMTSDWGSASTERGRTVYRLVGDDRLEVTDFVQGADGQYRQFGLTAVARAGRIPPP